MAFKNSHFLDAAIGLLLAAALLCGPSRLCFGLPAGFELGGRTVLVDAGTESSTAPVSLSARGVAVSADGASVSFRAELDAAAAANAFALRVEGEAPADGWDLTINGKALETDPIVGPDGFWYGIPARSLKAGANDVVVASAKGEAAEVKGLLGFSMDFAEEEYFQEFVGPVIRNQPASDANQDLYDVQQLDLAITIDPASASIPGAVATITAKSLTNGLNLCVLDFNDNAGAMHVTAVDAGTTATPLTYTWDTAGEKLRINLATPVTSGSLFTVRVTYDGTPVATLAYRRTTQNSVPVVYTNNQPYNARTWYPCKDLPRDKFTSNMHATVPTVSYNGFPLSVVSNGTLVSTVASGGNTTYNWSESYPIASQYVSLACSNYQVASGVYTALDSVTTMPVAHHVYPTSYASESQELPRTIEVMQYMAQTFGEYPFVNEKYVTAAWALTFGVEHETCTSMPNGNLNNPPYHRRNIHEMAHQWFGVCTGIQIFDHLWLSEGWASYVEALWLEYKNGDAAYKTQMATFKSSSSDSRPVVSPAADDFGLAVTYYKGAWVLHMLRHVVGDANFFQATRDYMANPNLRNKTVVSADFQAHQEARYGQSLQWFFDEWLTRSSRPAYSWSWSSHQSGADWFVDVSVTQTQGGSPYTMPIDIGVTLADNSTAIVKVFNDQTAQAFSVKVGTVAPTDATFDPNAWILCTATEIVPTPPSPPTLLSVVGNGAAGTVTIKWTLSPTSGVTSYRLYASTDGLSTGSLIQDGTTLGAQTTSTVVTGLSPGQTRYFRLTAVGTGESLATDVYGVRLGTGAGQLLIVDAYDRWNTQSFSGGLNHAFAASHGRAVAAHGNSFDSCANEAVGSGVSLGGYAAVVWAAGDESTVDETFSSSEQTLVSAYVVAGGKLFVTGNEIGWDLGRTSRPAADQAFYAGYLKAAYVADNAADFTVDSTGGVSCFGAHSFTYGNGGDSPYLPGFPDVISASGGSTAALQYSAGNAAGIQYKGVFGAGSAQGALVYLAFSFETVYPESGRLQMMSDVLNYFGLTGFAEVANWPIY
ncbi:MAG: hypothetical protein K1X53_02175 [Candidatus Sumerlaeaceae bacterium]|nr:hypothetical protein [Candidatus Sumerlaeaceae bacterium]